MNNLPALQSKILNDDELSKHRAFIAIKAQSLMGRYFQVPQDEMIKRDILLGWMDMLQDYTNDEITKACKQYLIEYPSKRPHEGLIRQLIVNARKRYIAIKPKIQIEAPIKKEIDIEKRRKIANKIMQNYKR